jgi:hypothetical protein
VIRLRHRGGGSHAPKLASDWELFVTLRKQKNKEMKRLKRALFSRDADATAYRRSMDPRHWRAASSCATRDPDPCPQIVRLYAKASEPRMEQSNRVGGITTVFREHTSSWVPTGVRRVRRGQLRPRDS